MIGEDLKIIPNDPSIESLQKLCDQHPDCIAFQKNRSKKIGILKKHIDGGKLISSPSSDLYLNRHANMQAVAKHSMTKSQRQSFCTLDHREHIQAAANQYGVLSDANPMKMCESIQKVVLFQTPDTMWQHGLKKVLKKVNGRAFCGPAGGAPPGTFPVGTKEERQQSLQQVGFHNSYDPDAIRACVREFDSN